jgi:serralysin
MQPGKRSTLRQDQEISSAGDAGLPAETFRTAHAGASFEAATRSKTIKVDRDSHFLADAADGADPTPDDDEDLDTLADFLVDGWHEYYEEERRAFEIGDDNSISVQISGLSNAGQKLALNALEVWTYATGINFKVVRSGAEIVINDDFASAYTNTEVDGNTITSAFINISDEWLANNGTGIHDYSMLTFIHEMGHALGLGHAGVYDFSGNPVFPDPPLENDSWQASIMSYFAQDENDNIDADYAIPVTPMMADLLAIQELYGEVQLRAGRDVYGFKADIKAGASLTVLDGGGIDRLDFSWSKIANVIDLTEEAFSSINGVKGNLGIARGTVIEAAVGGTAGDTILGNDYANALYGNLGADTLTGNDGEDFFVFDTTPSAGNADTITDFTAGVDSLVFNNAIFSRIGKDGTLAQGALAVNDIATAAERNDRVIYNSATGELFYDADGSRSGKAVLIAEIGAGLALTAADVLVI